MRLLDTTSLEFREFPDIPEEPYAILSHRWGSEEVTFKEYRKTRETIKHRAGYQKIVDFCRVAQQRGLQYAWVDTCCIDKRSSAELSEAINSMYRWYKQSAECYVFLEDYDPGDSDSLDRCEWFSRGWTLQELIAPEYCIFFTATWTVIGHKHHWKLTKCPCNKDQSEAQEALSWGPDLLSKLAAITKINIRILTGTRAVYGGASVAQRMSWASHRASTRVEDRAYSLMGIFNINMPLLYGEGHRAFRRLQEEIIRTTHDTSIFCFGLTNTLTLDSDAQQNYRSTTAAPLLAESPAQFTQCQDIRQGRIVSNEPYAVTNMGLRMIVSAYTRVEPRWQEHDRRVYAIPLECRRALALTSNRWPSVFENLFLVVQQLHVSSGGSESTRVVRVDLHKSVGTTPLFERLEHERWELAPPQMFYIRL